MIEDQTYHAIRTAMMAEYEQQGCEVLDASSGGIAFFVKPPRPWKSTPLYPVHLYVHEGSAGYSELQSVACALHPSTYLCSVAVAPDGTFTPSFLQASIFYRHPPKRTVPSRLTDHSPCDAATDDAEGLTAPAASRSEHLAQCVKDLTDRGYYCAPADDPRFDLLVNRYGEGHRYFFTPLRLAVLETPAHWEELRTEADSLPEDCLIYARILDADGTWHHEMRPPCYFGTR